MAEAPSLYQWTRATFLGWIIGIVLVIALAVAWESVGGSSQFMVGIGMGLGVGWMQSRLLSSILEKPKTWWIASTAGLGLPFVLVDALSLAGASGSYSLPLAVAVGGLLVGIAQARLLYGVLARSQVWMPAAFLGWVLAAGATVLADYGLPDFVTGLAGALLYLATVLLGGLGLGLVTGWAWGKMPPISEEASSTGIE